MSEWMKLLVILTTLLTAANSLLDGGDFIIVDADKNSAINDNLISSQSRDTCPVRKFEDIFLGTNDLICLADSGPKEGSIDDDTIQETVIKIREIPVSDQIAEPNEILTDDVPISPPPVVKAIPVTEVPRDVTEKTIASPIIEEQEELNKPNTEIENDTVKFERQESAVDEEGTVQEDPKNDEEGKDVIAPFSQWAEKKLEEQAALKDATKKEEPEVDNSNKAAKKISTSQSVTKTNGAHKMNKNFASPDCSAKIVGANSGSQGSGNVIAPSRDEYFLNKCTDKAWFVVELCESIKAVKVQIANFELYSSSPHQFKVSIGNTFPAREKDWIEFGTFDYEDERSVQTFTNEIGVVGKYAKVEIMSHHGSEHFCPVSLFKVFGIPEIDLITEDDPDEDRTEESPEDLTDDEPKHHPIVQTIKDAVHKVVNVFRPQNVSLVETLNTSSLEGASLRFRLRPEAGDKTDQTVINRYHMIYYLLATQYSKVKQYSLILNMNRMLPCICDQFGISFQPETCNNTGSNPWQFIKFVMMYHGDDFMVALCNLASMEVGQSRLVERGHQAGLEPAVNSTLTVGDDDNGTKLSINEALSNTKDSVHTQQIDLNHTANIKKVEETPMPGIKEVIQDIVPDVENVSGSQKDETKSQEKEILKTQPAGSPSQAATQTTWQKLSNRIKALERNVTLSTGFLEELSLKYIKQIEELNSAVKIANDAISGILRREEIARDRTERLVDQVDQLTKSMKNMEENLVVLQDEIFARHGLLLLGEVLFISLVFLLCRPDSIKKASRLSSVAVPDNRRRSLDTMKDIREKKPQSHDKRRSSIEVGCLRNGQAGSLVQSVEYASLTKRQKKRKRRKDSKQMAHNLRNVTEEMESDASLDTPGGRRHVRRRSNSWSEQVPGESLVKDDLDKTPSPVFKYPSMQSTPNKVYTKSSIYQDTNHNNGWKCKDVKTVRFPSKYKLVDGVYNPCQPPEVSNIFSMLEHSVHDMDSSACETETDDKRGNRLNPNKVKTIRSKSSSPNRQENLLRKQREAIRKFQPEQVEWLQQKRNEDL